MSLTGSRGHTPGADSAPRTELQPPAAWMTTPKRDLSSFEIHRQPDDVTCGPTCLHAVYRQSATTSCSTT